MGTNKKKGISLIVLIITIIVMIILAAAIILTISNSGIVDKANKAKEDSDTANLKEYVNILEAEWEMMTKEEQKNTGKSRIEYINAKLNDKGYENATFGADGEIYTGLNEIAKKAIAGGIKIGERVKYTVETKSTTSKKDNNGSSDQTINNKTDFVWRYIGVNEKGELLIAPDITTDAPKVYAMGEVGFSKFPSELNELCDTLYTVEGKGKATSINMNDIIRLLGYKVETSEPITITEKAKKAGIYTDYAAAFDTLIDGKALGDYPVNELEIYKSDTSNMKYPENSQYVFYGQHRDSCPYYLASTYSSFISSGGTPVFYFAVITACNSCVGKLNDYAPALFYGPPSMFGTAQNTATIRPVVTLEAEITKSSDSDGVIWVFNS